MSKHIEKIRTINKLIKSNSSEELKKFLSENEVDLNDYKSTTSPLKVAFSNFFTSRDFTCLGILIDSDIDIFQDHFVFKLLKYRKKEEFKIVLNKRREDILNFSENGFDFLAMLKNYTDMNTYTYIKGELENSNNNLSEKKKNYESVFEVVKAKDIDFLRENKENYQLAISRHIVKLVNIISYSGVEGLNYDNFVDFYDFVSQVYSVKEILKNSMNNNFSLNISTSLGYLLKQTSDCNRTKIKLINILDEYYKDIKLSDVTKKNNFLISPFSVFQHMLNVYIKKRNSDLKVVKLIEEKNEDYVNRNVFFPLKEFLFFENLIAGTLNKTSMFSDVKLSKSQIDNLLKEPSKDLDNYSVLKDLKTIWLTTLLINSGKKQFSEVLEVMKENDIKIELDVNLFPHDDKYNFDNYILLKSMVEKNITNLKSLIPFIKDNYKLFDMKNKNNIMRLYINNCDKPSSDLSKFSYFFKMYNENSVENLSEVNKNESAKDFLCLQAKKTEKIFEEYLKQDGVIDNLKETVFINIIKPDHNFKTFEARSKLKFLSSSSVCINYSTNVYFKLKES